MRQVIDAGKQRPERLAIVHHAADRDATETNAVIGLLAADQPLALSFAASPVIGECDLERRVDGFGPGVGEEDMVEPGGSNTREPIGELERGRVAKLKRRRVVESNELSVDGFSDLAPIVAGVYAPQTRCPVENAATVSTPVIHPVSAREQAWICLELAVRREGHPPRFQI